MIEIVSIAHAADGGAAVKGKDAKEVAEAGVKQAVAEEDDTWT